jgi:cobalamin biosynthesis protein CobD/CbiB
LPGDDGPPDAAIQEIALAAGEEALHPQDRATEERVRQQMNGMYARDRAMAWGFVIALLIVVPFTYVALWSAMPNAAVRIVLLGACAVLLLYNVASMIALVRNFAVDRDFVYRRDVAHARERATLRALKAQR